MNRKALLACLSAVLLLGVAASYDPVKRVPGLAVGTGGITSDGSAGATNTIGGAQTIFPGTVRVGAGTPPATATASGNPGQISWDSAYVYICIGTNTWRRAALSSW